MTLERRVKNYPGFVVGNLADRAVGTRDAIAVDMKQLVLTADQVAFVDESALPTTPTMSAVLDDEALLAMPLFEAKQLVAAEFERKYLVRVMERAGGSISEGARQCGIDRTNFRRLLQRHGLRSKEGCQ